MELTNIYIIPYVYKRCHKSTHITTVAAKYTRHYYIT